MGELPTTFEFGEYLSHTFPGFFSAVTFFMLLDIWSPQNLTAWAIKDISGLISFTTFILLTGTIFGVILDGIRHSLLEEIVFSNLPDYKKVKDYLKSMMPGDKLKLSNYFFLNTISKTPAEAHSSYEFLVKNVYRYGEFYGNTSISLVMFTFVVPFYLYQVLFVPWNYSFLIAFFSLIISLICLYGCYQALKSYQEDRFSQICGYLDMKVKMTVRQIPDTNKFSISAIIVHKTSLIQCSIQDLKIILETTSGEFEKNGEKTIIATTNPSGFVYEKLILDENESAEVIASSENCIPVVIPVVNSVPM